MEKEAEKIILSETRGDLIQKAKRLETEVRKDKKFGKSNLRFARDTVGYEPHTRFRNLSMDDIRYYIQILDNLRRR